MAARQALRRRGAAPLLILFAAAAFGLGAGTVRRYEAWARADVSARLQPLGAGRPAKKVALKMRYPGFLSPALGEVEEARIEASNFAVQGLPFTLDPWRSKRGWIGRLVVDMREFELSGLPIERLLVSIPNCRYDFAHAMRHGEIRISRAGVGTARVVLRPEDIAAWEMRRSKGLHGVVARIEAGRLHVEGRIGFQGFDIPFDVRSSLGGDGPRLILVSPEIRLGGSVVTAENAAALTRALNPVLDADRDLGLLGAVAVKRVTCAEGRIIVEGTATIPVDPAKVRPTK